MLKHNFRAQRDAYVEERTWSTAFEHLAVSVAQLTVDRELLSVNKRMCELIGQPERNLLQRSLNEFFLPEESWPECEGGLGRLIGGEIPHYATKMSTVRAAGQPVWVSMVFSVVRDERTNRPRSLTAVANDITSIKRAEQELRDAEMARDDLSRG